MRPLERHRDAGAYALGVLDEADAFRFEDHLMECVPCRDRVSELAAPARLLKAHGRSVAYVFDPAAAPGPRLLGRLVDETGRVRRTRRRRWLGAVAAGVVLAVVGPAAAVMSAGGDDGAVRVAAHDGRSGMAAVLTARERAWGTEVGIQVRDGGGGRRVCELVAVGDDGSREVVTTWRGPGRVQPGQAAEREWETRGGTALAPERIDRFEVRDAGGERLLTLRPR
ncbi:zf-HC2 domain-containing protein [Streptomyces flavofungini]|uniref:Zf-HC2 domain-containing protein n=1 Tax=Streptomyces flavofungini TaxID=68200 RepID=A0ABS0XH29_9ACTN|nr:zf-HC2 domain-containing protein [Streptomyces flavofungini]MBJ3812507.1 zf-HC2 domain-containing protein [Streptomyces flavofungini]GHC88719.1 membrane protein [Streptomyces flavofungini]